MAVGFNIPGIFWLVGLLESCDAVPQAKSHWRYGVRVPTWTLARGMAVLLAGVVTLLALLTGSDGGSYCLLFFFGVRCAALGVA